MSKSVENMKSSFTYIHDSFFFLQKATIFRNGRLPFQAESLGVSLVDLNWLLLKVERAIFQTALRF